MLVLPCEMYVASMRGKWYKVTIRFELRENDIIELREFWILIILVLWNICGLVDYIWSCGIYVILWNICGNMICICCLVEYMWQCEIRVAM